MATVLYVKIHVMVAWVRDLYVKLRILVAWGARPTGAPPPQRPQMRMRWAAHQDQPHPLGVAHGRHHLGNALAMQWHECPGGIPRIAEFIIV